MLKSIAAAVLATALAAPAFAGQVYGNYGQNQYQGQPPARGNNCEGDVAVGTGIGAIVGGVIGNQFGRGSGRTAATIGGVILGGIAGNAIAKDACKDDRQDAYYYNDTYYDAFNDPDDGEEYAWSNPHTNNYGTVTPGVYYEDGYQDYSGPCREFEQRVYIDGRPETATGVACKQPDGTWRIVNGN
ncbi:MAG: glycine zipper 2TM domain-containing protein [Micropepsaceae bacterium]